ncbi:hypothetical protein LTR86_000664 [Recurvomyces mirabilis]|nr:hypothetical protein LTR86_000664 [Recurvomyces mirabilis]
MPSAVPFQIVVVGGGIAGLCAAIALRGLGRQVTILEQSRLLSEIGATISLQPNASRILAKEWKLEMLLDRANGMVDEGFRIFNVEGKMVNSVPLLSKTEYGGDRIMYHRQDLHKALQAAALDPDRSGPPAIVRAASRVASCDCATGSVTLESGEEIYGDVIIGADGIHSILRDTVVGEHINTIPTGLSAYRMVLQNSILEQQCPTFCEHIKPREPATSMMMAHSCRLIMGPARQGDIFSIVGLVPDEKMNEDTNQKQSWVSRGDLDKMLDTYQDFPEWMRDVFKQADDLGLWQLRDIDPLPTWTTGRVILIGDAAHAMLPTQGQGASQAVEDAEALGAFFADLDTVPSAERVQQSLKEIFACRYERASLIQKYSRDAAKPATEKGSNEIKMSPADFMDYNCTYPGAKSWFARQTAKA